MPGMTVIRNHSPKIMAWVSKFLKNSPGVKISSGDKNFFYQFYTNTETVSYSESI